MPWICCEVKEFCKVVRPDTYTATLSVTIPEAVGHSGGPFVKMAALLSPRESTYFGLSE